MRYLKGTIDHGIFYKKGDSSLKLLAFMDSDYASDLDDRRSTLDLYLCWELELFQGHQRNNLWFLFLIRRHNI